MMQISAAGLAAAIQGARGVLAPRLTDPGDDPVLREHGLLEDSGLTDAGREWFGPVREPTYVFRIERGMAGVAAAQSFYVSLPTQRAVQVLAEADGSYTLVSLPLAEVQYAGLIEAAGIWPGTHPEPEPDATPPSEGEDAEAALVTTLVVLHDQGDGFTEHELSWLDLDEDGLWLLEDGTLSPTSDYALYQRIPPLLHVLDR